jgi:ketosteroid isomerase-like protein
MSRMSRNFTGATRLIKEAREKDASTGARHMAAVEAILAAVANGEYDAAVTDVREDVTLDIFAPPEFCWLRRARGRQELRKAMEHNFGPVTDQRAEITTVLAQDDYSRSSTSTRAGSLSE